MAVQDITRLLDPAPKHYSGSRLEQGRALVDSDFNEARRADDQELQLATLDIVGRKASPGDGFLPDLKPGDVINPQLIRFGSFFQSFVLNYSLKPGSIYVGGWRFVQEETEPVAFQREYLQMGPATAPRAAVGTQRQLSYLRGWEQPVTAVEDSELIEPALHGADSAVRVRRMRQVEVRNVEADDCAAAFEEVLAELGHGSSATYDPASCELRSNARLRMGFFGEAAGDCEGCEPALRGKYLGSEDHTVKVMLAAPGSYVWAFDNGAPLYRVKLILDGDGGATVEMLTPPKDTFHEPVLNNVVEFLPWSVLLDNGKPAGGKAAGESVGNEKLATRAGFFAEVDTPYETGPRSFHVRLDPGSLSQIGFSIGKSEAKSLTKAQLSVKTGESPAAEVIALEWDPAHPHAAELNPSNPSAEDLITYVYMRVWHVKKPGEPLTIPTSSQAPLGRTGLVATFGGSGRRGDFWRATVRTEARDEILPLTLMGPGGVPPDGPREVVAPLALLQLNSAFGGSHQVVSIHDCRPSLPAITNRGCCTYVVGTGPFTHFQSIQAALDALPRAGGHICVLPGTYREQIRASGRTNVKISGCGRRTVIESPAELTAGALVELQSEPAPSRMPSSMVVEKLSIRAQGQIAIRASGHGVELRDLSIEVSPTEEGDTPNAIRALNAGRLEIVDNRIRMRGGLSHHAAVYLGAVEDATLERNRIETVAQEAEGRVDCWGGVHISGGSRRIEVRDNDITGGRGHGLTLGSVRFRATDGSELGIEGAGLGQSAAEPPFALSARIEPVDRGGPNGGAIRYYPDPDPAIEDLLIDDNRIREFRGSGIASLAPEVIHDDVATGPPLCIRRTTFAVEHFVVRDNQIEDNARGLPGDLRSDRARGGIILSEVQALSLVRNRIESNGFNPDSGPIHGIFVGYGDDLLISGNRVVNNGLSGGQEPTDRAPRGAIVLARPVPEPLLESFTLDASISRVMLRANVVESSLGPALSMIAGGHCSVLANHLESRTRRQQAATITSTVLIAQPGRPWEAVDLPPNEPNPARWNQPVGSQEYLGGRAQDVDNSGGLVFADNQVTTISAVEAVRAAGVPVLILSTDSVVMSANQLSAEASRNSISAHCWVVGSTVNIARNRIAEGIETTRLSLVAMAPMLTLATDNILTHCPAIFGCLNHNNPLYFVDEGNLTWFRMLNRRCETEAEAIFPSLRALCQQLFGLGSLTEDEIGGAFNRGLSSIAAFRRFER
jgi:hypothetical protein